MIIKEYEDSFLRWYRCNRMDNKRCHILYMMDEIIPLIHKYPTMV